MDANAAEEFQFLTRDAARVNRSAPAMQRVTVPGVDQRPLSALRTRSDRDRSCPLVCLHGAGLNAHSFDPMVCALDMPVVAIDLPGHGHSAWRDDAVYTPATMVDDAVLGVEAWGDTPVTLLGHSLGGLTAMRLAAQRPELVRQLIIVDITPEVTMSDSAATVIEFICGKRSYESRDEMVDRAIDFGIGSDREVLLRGVTLNSVQREDGRFEWIHHLAHLGGLNGADGPMPEAEWPALELPITLVRATEGMVTAADAQRWCEHYPQTEVVELRGPHNLHEACPAELAEVVQGVCDRV